MEQKERNVGDVLLRAPERKEIRGPAPGRWHQRPEASAHSWRGGHSEEGEPDAGANSGAAVAPGCCSSKDALAFGSLGEV